jgi:hypothetical protein
MVRERDCAGKAATQVIKSEIIFCRKAQADVGGCNLRKSTVLEGDFLTAL